LFNKNNIIFNMLMEPLNYLRNLKVSKSSKQKWISLLDDHRRYSSSFDKYFGKISYKSFRLILIFALIVLLVIVIRGILFGGPFPLADTANFVFLIGVYLLVVYTNIRWRPLAWIVLFSFALNSIDGLIPLSTNPITPTHLLLPLLVFYGAILGVFSLSFVAAIIVLGIYCSTAIFYWPLSRADFFKLSNLMMLTVVSATAAYYVYLYHRKMMQILRDKTVDLEKELDTNIQLVAVIFHDITNPVSAIIGNVELIKHHKYAELSDIERIEKSTDRIFSIIESVRELIAGTRGSLNTENIKISDIAHELNDIFTPRLEQKEQKFILTAGSDLEVKTHPAVICNSVLSNILSNAIKFSPRGSSIEMSASREGDFVRIEVLDKGKGFPQVLLERIINGDRYTSIPGTEEEEGHGYGLRIAAMYVQRLQGTLEIRNREEGGATVAILLPVPSEPRGHP